MIRILIADDHDVVRFGLRQILQRPDWEIVGEASDGRDAVTKSIETKPDVAIIDYSLPRLNGLEATRQIRERVPKTEILIFTMYDAEEMILSACQAGARGFILKSDDELQIVEVIKVITRHEPSVATATRSLGEKFFRPPRTDSEISDL